ncbi:uncharacterized protein METZ01_LOCUS12190 [marine metagenome]|uniref:Uncharacterized protein n=1 Tax=marine metagenome TaxID=408172 RepID=A0A381NXI7_9ZZZZ
MLVRLAIFRRIEIYHTPDVAYVYSTRSDVGCNQDPRTTATELLH